MSSLKVRDWVVYKWELSLFIQTIQTNRSKPCVLSDLSHPIFFIHSNLFLFHFYLSNCNSPLFLFTIFGIVLSFSCHQVPPGVQVSLSLRNSCWTIESYCFVITKRIVTEFYIVTSRISILVCNKPFKWIYLFT